MHIKISYNYLTLKCTVVCIHRIIQFLTLNNSSNLFTKITYLICEPFQIKFNFLFNLKDPFDKRYYYSSFSIFDLSGFWGGFFGIFEWIFCSMN